MKMSTIEIEKKKNARFAEKNEVTEDEMEEIYQKIFEELPEDMDEGKKIVRALRKTRGTLRRRIQSGNYVDGFLLFRFRNQDYNLFAWNQVDEFVKENGLEKAQELGKADEDGNYLHTKGFSAGEIIDKDAIFGSAIGIFQDENGNPIPKWVSIGQYSIKDKIPLCQELKINIKEGKKAGPLFPNEKLVYYNDCKSVGVDPICTEEEIETYENIIKDLFGDIIFNDFTELTDYCSEKLSDKNHFAGVRAICTDISPQKDPTSNIPVEFEIGEETVVTLWIRPEIFTGLAIEDGLSGILFVTAYQQKDEGIGFNVGGFLPFED